jgi:lipooligosaccharide transport system ATP-binding protein
VVILDQGIILDVGSPGELIARHIEPHVVEVSGDGVKEWLQEKGQAHVRRAELVGETVFCYLDNVDDLLQELRRQDKFTYLHRPANLEDVFLKLTGRDLRD